MHATPNSPSLEEGFPDFFGNVAPYIPPNLPAAKKHPYIRVFGLQAWFGTLDRATAIVFLRYLFDFDATNGTADASVYLRVVETTKLASCYDMANEAGKSSFLAVVRWNGEQVDPPFPPLEIGDANTGYCYLAAVVPTSREAMRDILGYNPWGPSIASYLLARPGEWAPGRFQFSMGHDPATSDGPAYLQCHLASTQNGMRVRELIPWLAGLMRVGAAAGDRATLIAPEQSVVLSHSPTVFDQTPSAPSMRIALGMYARVTVGTPLKWSPMSNLAHALMLGVYESVTLVSARFQLTVPSGQANTGYAAVVSSGTKLASGEWLGAPVLKLFPGSDNGSVVGSFALPEHHQFGRELRALTMGNLPPSFNFAMTGNAGEKLIITGQFEVDVRGHAVVHAVDVNSDTKFKKMAALVHRSLGYPINVKNESPDADDSDDETEDDEPVAASAATPTRGSPANSRTGPLRNRE